MADLSKTTSAQYPLVAQFTWEHDDTMDDINGASKNFGSSDLSGAFGVIKLPPNAIVVGGDLAILEAFDTAGYDVIIGDADDTDRYFATADVKSVGVTALLKPGYSSLGKDIRLTIATDDVCTTGKARLTVFFVLDGRAQENI